MLIPTFRYHEEHGANKFDAGIPGLMEELKKRGWKNTPAGMGLAPYCKEKSYSERLRRRGVSIEDELGLRREAGNETPDGQYDEPSETIPAPVPVEIKNDGIRAFPEVEGLLADKGLSLSSWMRTKGLDDKSSAARQACQTRYNAVLAHFEGKIIKKGFSWYWIGDN